MEVQRCVYDEVGIDHITGTYFLVKQSISKIVAAELRKMNLRRGDKVRILVSLKIEKL